MNRSARPLRFRPPLLQPREQTGHVARLQTLPRTPYEPGYDRANFPGLAA
jgi:hypothetical protein